MKAQRVFPSEAAWGYDVNMALGSETWFPNLALLSLSSMTPKQIPYCFWVSVSLTYEMSGSEDCVNKHEKAL